MSRFVNDLRSGIYSGDSDFEKREKRKAERALREERFLRFVTSTEILQKRTSKLWRVANISELLVKYDDMVLRYSPLTDVNMYHDPSGELKYTAPHGWFLYSVEGKICDTIHYCGDDTNISLKSIAEALAELDMLAERGHHGVVA